MRLMEEDYANLRQAVNSIWETAQQPERWFDKEAIERIFAATDPSECGAPTVDVHTSVGIQFHFICTVIREGQNLRRVMSLFVPRSNVPDKLGLMLQRMVEQILGWDGCHLITGDGLEEGATVVSEWSGPPGWTTTTISA